MKKRERQAPQNAPGAAVNEQDLPGIGRRYVVPCADGGEVSVVIHHSGRRDLYVRESGRREVRASVTLSDGQARALGAIVAGAYFKPAVVEEIEATIGELLIDWVTIGPRSPAVGKSIAELAIRRRTRMTVAAIVRDHTSLIAPEPTEVIAAGDQLVVIGRQEDLGGFLRHVVG